MNHRDFTPHRGALTALLALLLAFTLAMPLSASEEGNDAIKATKAAEWVAENYEERSDGFGGFYADSILAMRTAPGFEDDIAAAARKLIEATDYYGDETAVNPAALAKTVFVLDTVGIDVTKVHGRDLLAELAAQVKQSGPQEGQLGDTPDIYGQVFAIRVLYAHDQDVDAMGEWLAGRQCNNGGYSFNGLCPGANNFFGVDADTTSMTLAPLRTTFQDDTADRALEYVLGQQNPDGSFSAYDTPNTNTSGLAATALREEPTSHDTEADAALEWILDLQFGPDSDAGFHGGLPFSEGDPEPDLLATNQGVLAVTTLTELSNPITERFTDVDDDNIFVEDITWLHHVGVTLGCNPPDNTQFCPADSVTRGQMAAFLVRALDLTETSGREFTDVGDDNVFATDIDKLATAGITLGCNPPDNTRYCPADSVTRGQMAAFLVRALDLTETSGREFTDVGDDNVFATDIDKLATAGITLGCNPPDNTRYCPDGDVTRAQMAAFLHRSFDIR